MEHCRSTRSIDPARPNPAFKRTQTGVASPPPAGPLNLIR